MNRFSFRLGVLAAACAVSFGVHAGGSNEHHPSDPHSPGNSSPAAPDARALAVAAQLQLQGQQQGQAQRQNSTSSSKNTNNNMAAGGIASSKSGDVSNANNLAGVGGGNTVAPNQSTTVGGDTYAAPEIPVQSAYSAGLVASNGTCMGSSSGGATGPGFSATFGTTWKDTDCSRRYTAESLKAAGRTNAAFGVLCQIADVRAATPRECDAMDRQLGVKVAGDQIQQVVAAKEGSITYNAADPYIAARMAGK